ncbi:MAG TPA: hypothetical protein VD994_10600 [Prosthecobacter sp.]|nr:hypothetical protein [Prosthecobacter sp.]
MSDISVKMDYAIGSAAASSWWWLPHFDGIVHVLLGIGGVFLLFVRGAIALKDWRNKKRGE